MNTPTTAHYTRTAKSLHWLMALMIFGLLALGFYMSDLPLSPEKLQYYAWHKWAGVSVFAMVWLRLVWRVTHRPPAMPDNMSALMQKRIEATTRIVVGYRLFADTIRALTVV